MVTAAPAEGFVRCCATFRASMGDGSGEAAHQVSARRDRGKKSDPKQIAHAAETHG
jgi:hypothetical protein